jgi:hypothetical protein
LQVHHLVGTVVDPVVPSTEQGAATGFVRGSAWLQVDLRYQREVVADCFHRRGAFNLDEPSATDVVPA